MASLFRPLLCAVLAAACVPQPSIAQSARVGDPAPAFTATDSHGKTQSLDQLRGKFVVLEWHNQGCPYTKKHYDSGNMQSLQKEWTGKGVAWFTVISSAPGAQGYVTASQENDYLAQMHAAPTAALLDPDGKLGRLYNAKTTPDMYVIDPAGKLIYTGAIDSRPTAEAEDIRGADNYVSDALAAAMAGKPVAMPYTRSYGCSVKYRE
jgi:peroxiredoxin